MTEDLDILIFAAHPDDAEIGMAGTIYKSVMAGQRAGICDLTLAELSSNGTVQIRQKEAAHAANLLSLSMRVNLELPDRGLRLEKEQIDLLVEQIRRYRPRIVLAPYWDDRHPDHVMCSQLVDEAVFNAKLRQYRAEWPAWTVEQQYYYFINNTVKPDVVIDISQVYEQKKAALRAYASQFTSPDRGNHQVATPLTQGYLERVEARDQAMGQTHAIRYAEGFVSKVALLKETL